MISSKELLNKDVILTPFDIRAIILYHQLARDGIRVRAFCDKNPYLMLENYQGVPILPRYYSENRVAIICHDELRETLYADLERLKFPQSEILFYRNIVTDTERFEIADAVDLEEYQRLLPRQAFHVISKRKNGSIIIRQLRACARLSADRRKHFFVRNFVVLQPTKKCTLRCKNCYMLTDYLPSGIDCDFETTMKALQKFMDSVDFLNLLSVVGGEPFIYKRMNDMLLDIEARGLLSKIGQIYFTTNATVIPEEALLLTMSRLKVFVVVSNYLTLSRKLNGLLEKLNEHKIYYENREKGNWAIASLLRENEPLSDADAFAQWESCEVFRNNINLSENHIWNNRFYSCALISAGEIMGAVPFDETNSLDLLASDYSRETFLKYLDSYHPVCKYCYGGAKEQLRRDIPSGVQLKEPRKIPVPPTTSEVLL
jgi:organic radical activating enzyme